ncbi:MAG: MauE/DoxX family redox-associated membrane protein [Cyclobacteriaceae bacterium]
MVTEYQITGMTCMSCVAKVKAALSAIEDVKHVTINLEYPQAQIESLKKPALHKLQQSLSVAGNYSIEEVAHESDVTTFDTTDIAPVKLSTYRPLILIITFIAGVSILVQYPFENFNWMLWMRHFMAGFFLVFSFFKLLNLPGFASSYRMYDIVAEKLPAWGYIYPFIELTLGISYLLDLFPFITNLSTVIILGISSIGVIKSNLSKRKIKCACLGDVFNLPMSTVTIVEDLTMVGMAVIMLLLKT